MYGLEGGNKVQRNIIMSHKLLEERSERHFDLGEKSDGEKGNRESDGNDYRSEYGYELKHHQQENKRE